MVIRSIASIRLINYKGHIHHHPFLDTPKDRVINVSMLQQLPVTHLHITTFPLETLFRLLAHLFCSFGIGSQSGTVPSWLPWTAEYLWERMDSFGSGWVELPPYAVPPACHQTGEVSGVSSSSHNDFRDIFYFTRSDCLLPSLYSSADRLTFSA